MYSYVHSLYINLSRQGHQIELLFRRYQRLKFLGVTPFNFTLTDPLNVKR